MSTDQLPLAPSDGYRELMRNAQFRALLSAEMVLFGGESLYLALLPWLVLEITASKSAVGWMTAALYVPFLLFAVPLGTLADRVDRRRLLMAVNLLRAALLAMVPALYAAHILRGWQVLTLVFLRSALNILFLLGRDAIIPQIVPKPEIVTAHSARLVFIGLSMMSGTALAGSVVRILGLGNAFGVCVATPLVSAALLTRLRIPCRLAPSQEQGSVSVRELLQGLSYVWHDPVVRGMFLLEALYFLLGDGPITVGLPLFVKDVLRGGPQLYGFIRAANYLGMLVGALWLGRFGRRIHKGRIIVLAWLGYGLSLIGFPWFRTFAPALAAAFFSFMVGNLIPACEATLMQEQVPHSLMGRVSGVWNMIAPGLGTFSGMMGGALAGLLPAGTLIALGAAISCANALLGRVGGLWDVK